MTTSHGRAVPDTSITAATRCSILLLIITGIIACASYEARADTRYVGSNRPYQSFQAALADSNPGDTIVLNAGETFVGPFVLPKKQGTGTEADWITIITSADTSLPPAGQRITPSYMSVLPKIVSPGGNQPALYTAPGAHHYRFIGIEFRPQNASVTVETVVIFGGTDADLDEMQDVPHHLVLDRCYIYAYPTQSLKRGVRINSAYTDILNCYIAGFKLTGEDSQAVMGSHGPGPFRIINNYLEAAGENLMFGGDDPDITGLVPSDIEIRHNYFFKPTEWRTSSNPHWTVKNLLELKNAQRVVIEGNVFENSWQDGQTGHAIVFTGRSQDGDDVTKVGVAPWSVVKDVQFTNNMVRHAGTGVQLLGIDYRYLNQYEHEQRINISNNIFEDISSAWGGAGHFLDISRGVIDLKVTHNTIIHTGSIVAADDNIYPNDGFVFNDNIARHNTYGVFGSGSSSGLPTLTTYFPGSTFRKNLITGVGSNSYPPDNYLSIPSSGFDSQFVNRTGSNYHLVTSSPGYHGATDGKDVGADIDLVNQATEGAINGTPATNGVGFSNSTYTVDEGLANTAQGFGSMSVEVTRTGNTSSPLTVRYITSDISGGSECNPPNPPILPLNYASQRCDYSQASGTLNFNAWEATKTITIPIINDKYAERAEYFSIRLEKNEGGNLGVSQAYITINDNDASTNAPINNPYVSVEFFVRQNYLDILGREPDAAGYATWTGVLNNCAEHGFLGAPSNCDRPFVSHSFIASPEFTDRGSMIYRMYEVGMHRRPRYNEFIPELTALKGDSNTTELEQNMALFLNNFAAKGDFISKSGYFIDPSQAAALIQRWEENAGVTLPATATTQAGQPPQYGRQQLINLRQSGQFTVGQTLKAFVEQQVVYDRFFARAYVAMQYFGFLRRDPDTAGFEDWVDVFANGRPPDVQPRDYHHLIFGLIYSEEYRKRFGAP
jgi:hypothetical protein